MSSVQNPVMNGFTILSAPPLGAYNDMPSPAMLGMQPPSMFMQPTIPLPGMSSIPGMGITQVMASPFTQFVNGMPWQPTTPSTSPSVSDHPCQGNGGSGCGCGGSCTGKSSTTTNGSQTQPKTTTGKNISTNPEIKIPQLEMPMLGDMLPIDFDFNRDILNRTPGSALQMTVTDQKGTRDIVSSSVAKDGSMQIKVKSARDLKKKVNLLFTPKGQNIWQIGNGISTKDVILPSYVSLDLLTNIAWASYLADGWTIDKIKKTLDKSIISPVSSNTTQFYSPSKNIVPSSQTFFPQINTTLPTPKWSPQLPIPPSTPVKIPTLPNTPYTLYSLRPSTLDTPMTQQKTMCITHDLVCTDINLGIGKIVFHNGGSTLPRYVPCVGEINVDVLDCCKQHDVNMWCATDPFSLAIANANVVACITSKINSAESSAYSGANFWCQLVQFFKGILDDLLGAISELITVIVHLIGDVLVVALGVINALIEAGTLGALKIIPDSWYSTILQVFGFVLSPDLTNFDGRNSDSCLCGGNVPTTICSTQSTDTNPCRDVCKEMGDSENCYNCHWLCQYDQDGKRLPGKIFDRGPNDSSGNPVQNCCPGTDSSCPAYTQQQEDPCPKCWDCQYHCTPGAYGYPVLDTNPYGPQNMPCCYGGYGGLGDCPYCQHCTYECGYTDDTGLCRTIAFPFNGFFSTYCQLDFWL
jgi:hypothetical protein